MDFYYSNGRNVQMLVALLKKHGIKKVIASPGTTNLEFVATLQHDKDFEMYSCIDERSAAYMACGLAAECGEPVVITCTEATASRDYYPGLTEAYHRKLPILAVTCLHDYSIVGHLEPQVIDRSVSPVDSLKLKVNIPTIKDANDEWNSMILMNKAILELTRNGGGPVHINLPWMNRNFDLVEKVLPDVHAIYRYFPEDTLPQLPEGRIAVFIGSHNDWTIESTQVLDDFCAANDAVVFCDHTSKYKGKYRILSTLMAMQSQTYSVLSNINLLIHIGEESGDSETMKKLKSAKEVWRVSKDGEIRDTFKKLSNVFEMSEEFFFKYYTKETPARTTYLEECKACVDNLNKQIPELPFSSVYVASQMSKVLPANSVIHLGVSDTIRAWSMFELPETVRSSCNAGCRGIDGCVSALIGASFANSNCIYYGVVGDLTFFYDLNCLGNRNIKNNVRILLVNNNGGNIFKHIGAPAYRMMGIENADVYVAAANHFGRKSPTLVKHFAEDLGFEYLTADSKESFTEVYTRFTTSELTEKPMLLEIFTEATDDSQAFELMQTIDMNTSTQAKSFAKKVLGEKGVQFAKKLIK